MDQSELIMWSLFYAWIGGVSLVLSFHLCTIQKELVWRVLLFPAFAAPATALTIMMELFP